jgi:hypothetical protein
MAGDGASEGLWGCSVVGMAAVVHPWGAGGGALSLEGRRRRLPMRGALAAALAAARQRDYGGGAVGRGSGRKNVIFSNRPYDQSKYSDPLIYVPI